MKTVRQDSLKEALCSVRRAAMDHAPIAGLTHCFYRYPARFSPIFARAAIEAFSRPGELVLDPYMGGGTTIVEAVASGRRAIGNDLNALAVFVARVKTTLLDDEDRDALRSWATTVVPFLSYRTTTAKICQVICERRTRNLTLPFARPIKKIIALALCGISKLPSKSAQEFARCALLSVGQWALNGRKRQTPLWEFRERLQQVVEEMLHGLVEFRERSTRFSSCLLSPGLFNVNAAELLSLAPFAAGERADLVVTSPPYPGIHMLYHRWQVDGRKETPAPYWIAACNDGQGAAYYNFADRRDAAADAYFDKSLRTLRSLRDVVNDGAYVVQMIAFGDPSQHLPRYLENLRLAGFCEVLPHRATRARRIWRTVPRRRWHADQKGDLHSSRELVLVHRAV